MEAKVDPSEHINLIWHVIHQQGLRGEAAEEAFSESLVTIVEAAEKFDPAKNIKLASWLALNIRWGIQNLKKHHWKDSISQSVSLETLVTLPKALAFEPYGIRETLLTIVNALEPRERQVILATACGYNGKEISLALGLTGVQVSRIKIKAQAKLREALGKS